MLRWIAVPIVLAAGGAAYIYRTMTKMPSKALADKNQTYEPEALKSDWHPQPAPGAGEWAAYYPLHPSDTKAMPWPGFAKYGWTSKDIAALESTASRLGQSPNAVAAIMQLESGLDPKAILRQKVKTKKGVKIFRAAGIAQFTLGANLKAIRSNDDLEALAARGDIQEQLALLEEMWRGAKPRPLSTPGQLYMLNFLPSQAYAADSVVLGKEGSGEKVGGITQGAIYAQNPGLRVKNQTFFTVGDVKAKVKKNIGRIFALPAPKKPQSPSEPTKEPVSANSPLLKYLNSQPAIKADSPLWGDIVRRKLWTPEQEKIGVGTTCLDYFGYALESAGLPRQLFEDKGRFRTGHKFNKYASERQSWITKPSLDDLLPGRAFELRDPNKKSNFHVGFVVEVKRDASAATVITQDGGQGPRDAQAVGRRTRNFVLKDGVPYEGKRRLTWVLKTENLFPSKKPALFS